MLAYFNYEACENILKMRSIKKYVLLKLDHFVNKNMTFLYINVA